MTASSSESTAARSKVFTSIGGGIVRLRDISAVDIESKSRCRVVVDLVGGQTKHGEWHDSMTDAVREADALAATVEVHDRAIVDLLVGAD